MPTLLLKNKTYNILNSLIKSLPKTLAVNRGTILLGLAGRLNKSISDCDTEICAPQHEISTEPQKVEHWCLKISYMITNISSLSSNILLGFIICYTLIFLNTVSWD